MKFVYKGQTTYSSIFDPQTGMLVRSVWAPSSDERYDSIPWYGDKDFNTSYGYRTEAFSPVPETVDVSITDKCNFGCVYCYQDSKPKRDHAPKELVETILGGFDQPPYQIAIGGGEPTLHPDFPYILRKARALGTVPNYTTAGDTLRHDVVEATNEVCGGVAMTYHAFKGIEWFERQYTALRNALKVQVNVHVIADKNVATCIRQLTELQAKVGPIQLVLLAYYPDVGRATMTTLLTKKSYQKDLPDALHDALKSQMRVAFSEGLLPYFLSRPEIGVDTRFAMRSEGRFSCYFDPAGRRSKSSFDAPWDQDPNTAWNTRSQLLWDRLSTFNRPSGDACYRCDMASRCATPHDFHYLMCGFAPHNQNPLKEPPSGDAEDAFEVLS